MYVSPQEVHDAKEAVRAFVHQVFWPNFTIGGEEYQKHYEKLVPFANTYKPLNSEGFKPERDFMAPSFWHLCCYELSNWVLSRQGDENGKIKTFAYRGQTHSWPISPSLWRSNIKALGLEPLKVVHVFLKAKFDDYKDIGVRFYESFQNPLGTAAILQHYKFPTNLVDITFNPLIGLYFAGKMSNTGPDKSGYGVFLSLFLSNLELIGKRTPFTFDFSLLPPDHTPRLYQQQGFFINCSHPDAAQHIYGLGDAFAHVYFPREYPEIPDFDEIFSDELMTKHTFFGDAHSFRGVIIKTGENEWYPKHIYYSELSKIFLRYCQENLSTFHKDKALDFLEKEMSKYPLHKKTMQGAPRTKESLELADSFSKSAEFLKSISFQYDTKTRIAPHILSLYAEQNPMLLKAIMKSGKKFRAFNLEQYSQELKSVNGLKQKLKKISSHENLRYLKNMVPVSDSQGGSVMNIGM